jgi:histidinol-phosphate aminotransferase
MPVRPNIAAMTGYVPGEQPQGGKLIKLNTNENPYQCSPKVKTAIGRVVQQGLQKYPDPLATAFRIRAGELLGVDPDWILCGNGSDDLLTIVTRAFVGSGDAVRFANPTYLLYRTLAELQDARSDVINYHDDWSLGDEFAKSLSQNRLREGDSPIFPRGLGKIGTVPDRSGIGSQPASGLALAYLANPNSPSGTMLPPARVAELAAALPCPLLVDEAYVDFAEDHCLSLVAANEKVMVTRTLSKSYALAGLRFGYLVAQPHVIRELVKVKDSYNCDALSIAGATAAIDDQAWLAETRGRIIATRERLTDELIRLGFQAVRSQANFVWCQHPNRTAESIYQDLKAGGVLVRCMRFAGWGDGLRISVGSDEQVDACVSLLGAIVG